MSKVQIGDVVTLNSMKGGSGIKPAVRMTVNDISGDEAECVWYLDLDRCMCRDTFHVDALTVITTR